MNRWGETPSSRNCHSISVILAIKRIHLFDTLIGLLPPSKSSHCSSVARPATKARTQYPKGMKTNAWILLATLATACVSNAALVYSDNFNRSGINDGTYAYTTTVTAGDGAATIAGSDTLQLSNDGSGAANANGRVFVTTPTSAFGSPFNSQLSQNAGVVTWTFNMQQIRPDPGGLSSGSYGVAFILGATSSDLTTANGYALVLGQSLATDPIRIARFAGGITDANLVNIVTGTSPLSDIGANYLSLSVTYDPSGNNWTLYGRNDGTSSFTDPSSGTLTAAGSAADSTYVGTGLSHIGAYWSYSSGAGQTALFDNFSIEVVPEPTNIALGIFAAGLLAFSGARALKKKLKTKKLRS